MLQLGLAENLDIAEPNGQLRVGPPESALDTPGSGGVFQIVQETAQNPRFLTSWDTLEAAMEQARQLNERTGNPFKTIMWGTQRPVVRVDPKRSIFVGDNTLPSFVYHKAAVKNHPQALPVSAVYGRQSEVIFTPEGDGVATHLGEFSLHGLDGMLLGKTRTLDHALAGAKRLSSKRKQRVLVKARVRHRRVPVLAVDPVAHRGGGLSGFALGSVVTPVTPAELEELRKMADGA